MLSWFCLLAALLVALTTYAQASPQGLSATVETHVGQDPLASFLRVVPIPLQQIFQAGRGIPAITGTSVVTPWNAVGQSRRVFFASGDSAREEITHYQEGRYFAYRVSEFTLGAKYVAKYAVGEWWWSEQAGQTTIRWRYTFVPKNVLVRPFLALFIRYRWLPYMQAAMARVQQDAAQQLTPANAPAR